MPGPALVMADLINMNSADVAAYRTLPGSLGIGRLQNLNPADVLVGYNTPTIGSLSPSTAVHGGAQFTLTVNGAGYSPAAVVSFGGTNLTTTFVNSGQLTAIVTAALIAAAGTPGVIVTNQPSGVPSASTTFTIT